MKQYDVDQATARREQKIRKFSMWLWIFLFPLGFLGLWFVFSAQYHPAHRKAPHPYSCAQMATEPDPLDAGGQIAPLCGKTPYSNAPAVEGDG